MNKLKVLAIACVVSTLQGCASIIDGSTQSVSIVPMRDGQVYSKATCTASNKKGSWVTSGGGAVTVKKASDALQVKCTDPQTTEASFSSAPKSTNVGWAVANFFLWDLCTISCIIDFSSGSIYEYPSQIQVPMSSPRPVATTMVMPAGSISSSGAGGISKEDLLNQLAADKSLSYEEYQRRYKLIMRDGQ